MAKKAQSEKDHVLHPKDIRELVAILRKDPVYKKNLGVRNRYWDSSPKAPLRSGNAANGIIRVIISPCLPHPERPEPSGWFPTSSSGNRSPRA